MSDAAAIVKALGMLEHPEGGWYAETWRAEAPGGERPSGSAILFLLAAGHRSHWHRLDADEVWQYSGGDPVELSVWLEGDPAVTVHRVGYLFEGRAHSGEQQLSVGASAGLRFRPALLAVQ